MVVLGFWKQMWNSSISLIWICDPYSQPHLVGQGFGYGYRTKMIKQVSNNWDSEQSRKSTKGTGSQELPHNFMSEKLSYHLAAGR